MPDKTRLSEPEAVADPRAGLPPPCEGCRTGNPFLCRSFSGIAPVHAQYENDYANWRRRSGLKVLLAQADEARDTYDIGTLDSRIQAHMGRNVA